jgi:hypothetical protein
MSMRFLFCLAVGAALSMGSLAQSPPAPSPSAPGADISPAILGFVPPALAQLGTQAVANESFTLDRTLLAAAAGFLPDSDADLRQTVARLDGLSVHMLRFAADGAADPGQVNAIREAYHLRGWKHIVNTERARGPDHDDTTDVWLVMDGANVRGGVVLVETPKSLTLATVAGNLSPLDLLHLRGHFGIPRFDDRESGNERDR